MLRIGVLGTANIAKTRMIPTILSTDGLEYAGVATASDDEWDRPEKEEAYSAQSAKRREKVNLFSDMFGGRIFCSYKEMLESDEIDAVYIPLPPSLHYKWGMEAIKHHKHILMEKPFTLSSRDTEELLSAARENNLTVIENYGFLYHTQFEKIKVLLSGDAIGELRLIRTAFGFPHRAFDDFRYSRYYGGGALYDCGGYTIKMATQFLREPIELLAPSLTVTCGHEVDISGSATLSDGIINVQTAFGMDHAYKCELELWGSKGILVAPRIYTAPADFAPVISIRSNAGEETISVPACDQFGKIAERFVKAIANPELSGTIADEIRLQSDLVERFKQANQIF